MIAAIHRGFYLGVDMSTSALQQIVRDTLFYELPIDSYVENSRPEWLYDQSGQRLELDFLISDANCAIEVQGAQHYTYIPFFHGDWDGFKQQLERDDKKREACKAHGITLFEISEEHQIDPAVRMISFKLGLAQDTGKSSNPLPPAIRLPAFDLFNLLWRKGFSRKAQIKRAEELLQTLIDAVSSDVEFTTYDQHIARWIIELIVSAEDRIKTLQSKLVSIKAKREAEKIKKKKKRMLSRSGIVPGVNLPRMPRNFTRAKQRKIEELPGIGYVVTGGRDAHLVQVDNTGVPICDCKGFFEIDYPCVHIWRYLKTYDFHQLCEIRNIIRIEKMDGDA